MTNGLGASADSQTATVSVGALCLAADTPIGQVQGTGASSPSAGASVTVQGVVVGLSLTQSNRAPLAQADSATTPINTAVTVNVLANDSDPDGDSLSLTAVSRPRRGTATIVGGQVRYAPKSGYVGTDSFTYTVSDGRDGTATASVTITMTR